MGSHNTRLLWLTTASLLAACTAAPPTGTPAATVAVPATPEAKAAHERLFAAADTGDINAFKAELTAASVTLLDQYFAAVKTYERDPVLPIHDWAELVADHKALSPTARARAPYPLTKDAGKWKLDLAARPEAQLFRDVVTASGVAPRS